MRNSYDSTRPVSSAELVAVKMFLSFRSVRIEAAVETEQGSGMEKKH